MDSTKGICNDKLVDYDWSIKGVFGSSSVVAHPPPPLVEVDFHLCSSPKFDKNKGYITESLKLEMDNQELKTLISSLEKSINNYQT